MIRLCKTDEFNSIYEIVNDAAKAYEGIIPEDRYHVPYMTREELSQQIDEGVIFWGYEEENILIGVMGIQDRGEVSLIRHAYVRTIDRNKGIGGQLLSHLVSLTEKPILIGTWAAAIWAIKFYQKNGFRLVSQKEKDELLKRYWSIPERQIDTSVVLVNDKWDNRQ